MLFILLFGTVVKLLQHGFQLLRNGQSQICGILQQRHALIRQVEEKLEKGIPIMAVNPGAGSSSVPGNGTAPLQGGEKPVGKAELPKAIPEDIQNVVSRWSRIVDETANPMKSYLKNAYPSLSGDGKLLVVVQDGLPSDYFKRQENRDQLKAVIGSVTGKDMEIIIQSAENGRNPEDLYPDPP